jgi:hypothetical protein
MFADRLSISPSIFLTACQPHCLHFTDVYGTIIDSRSRQTYDYGIEVALYFLSTVAQYGECYRTHPTRTISLFVMFVLLVIQLHSLRFWIAKFVVNVSKVRHLVESG